MRVHDLPPNAASLMEATRAIGYSLEAAIADLIDNSIAAGASRISVSFFPIGEPYVAILDNGAGMDEAELISAMRYGSQSPTIERKPTDLGRFGLGLKTASLSQCRRLTVLSKKHGSLSGAQWDLDYVTSVGSWALKLLDPADMGVFPHVDDLRAMASGTLVIWQHLDRMQAGSSDFEADMASMMNRVGQHLSLVFHRFLAGEPGLQKIDIRLNNVRLDPNDPFLSSKSTRIMDDEIINVDGQQVVIRPYLLPHVSKMTPQELAALGGEEGLKKQQGFYVYRNGRLLAWGTWFRLIRQGDLSKLARIQVNIPNSLDHLWTLDIKKSAAIPPESVRKNLRSMVERMADISQRTWTFRGKKETDERIVHVWNRMRTRNGGVLYEINREHPLVQAVDHHLQDARGKRTFEQLLTHIQRNLPLNSLYVDLTNDERLENDREWSVQELAEAVQALVDSGDLGATVEEVLAQVSALEPFDRYHEMLPDLVGKEKE